MGAKASPTRFQIDAHTSDPPCPDGFNVVSVDLGVGFDLGSALVHGWPVELVLAVGEADVDALQVTSETDLASAGKDVETERLPT